MLRTTTVLVALAVLSLVVGCAVRKGIKDSKGSTIFGVNMAFKEVGDCPDVSPEVQLENVPAKTKSVRLKFLNIEFGTTIFDNEFGFETTKNGLVLKGGKAMLPKGSVEDYNDPCAKAGARTYSIEAEAKDENGRNLGSATSTGTTGDATGTLGVSQGAGSDAPKPATDKDATNPAKPATP